MRKIFLIMLLGGILVSPLFALAQASDCTTYCEDPINNTPPPGTTCMCNPLKAKTFEALILALVDIIWILALAIAPLMIIIAGFYFVTAAGNPAQINTAKQIILWTLIGLLIVICAKGIIGLFQTVFIP